MEIPLTNPVINEEMVDAAAKALQEEYFVSGKSVEEFENEFAEYCGVEHAISTSSGTDALHLSLLVLGIEQGDEVITTPASFVATGNAVLHAGGTPKFADIDIDSYNIDPGLAEDRVTEDTKAIIPVHLYGYPADMDPINEMAESHGLFVVEDACQAHGATYKGRKVGSLGDVGCFSFYSTKCMTVAGDGGMIVTDDDEVAEAAAKLRDCGRRSRYIHDLVGYTARLNTVNAAIGRVQFRYLDEWNEMRRRRAGLYDRLLSDIDGVTPPPSGNLDIEPVYHLYVIRTGHRDPLKGWLEENGVECGLHYKLPIHKQPIYREIFGHHDGEYPRSEELCETCLSLPMYPGLEEEEIKYICGKIREFFDRGVHER